MTRQDLLQQISALLKGRKLVWFGTRGEDVQSLLDVPQLTDVFSLIAPLGSVSLNIDSSLEALTGVRLDLDTYNLDRDCGPHAREFRRCLFSALGEPSVLVPYRPLAFLTAVQYPRAAYVEYLGLFHERQAPFEHKPWVEMELKKLGLPTIPWRYHTDDDLRRVEEQLASLGRIILRRNRSDGGAGIVAVKNRDELLEVWQPQIDGFLASAPELSPHVPLNLSGCVFADGEVTLHPPSLQVLGVKELTVHPYGYCGNDFSAIKSLDPRDLDDLEIMVRQIGRWLASKGYLGAFGIDAMLYQGKLYVVELNARFQGSTALSAELDRELNRPDIYLCHIASFLGLRVRQAPKGLAELVQEQGSRAHLIFHNCGQSSVRRRMLPGHEPLGLKLMPRGNIWIKPNAILFRQEFRKSITLDGLTIDTETAAPLLEFKKRTFSATATSPVIHEHELEVRG